MSGAPLDALAQVGRYYGEKLREHGASPQGVDWNGGESQRLRFGELLRIRGARREYSLNDIGCGYGALADYVVELGERCDYLGVDISPAMIEKARELHRARTGCRFLAGERADRNAEYTVASGVFNVKLDTPPAAWREHVLRTIDAIDQASTRGFAFNCLTQYSDAERMRPHLYYADPCELFDYCKRRFSRNVALLHDYGLYEFTLLVRKDLGA
jgi:SAM-dependent methyltransferase